MLDNVIIEDGNIPGVALHVEMPTAGLSWSGAAGVVDRDSKIPLTPQHPVRIASNTKTFVAAAILRLWEDGLLDLDSPMAGHLPSEFSAMLRSDGYDPEAITIRHLLTHTSGLFDYGDYNESFELWGRNPKRRWTRGEQLQVAMDWGDAYGVPGEVFRYADTGYILLGEILERVSGKPMGVALRQLVDYEGIDLTSTWLESLEPRPEGVPDRAHQYMGGVDTYTFDPSADLYGGGGLVSTVGDLARFMRGIFTGRVYKRPGTVDTMLSTVPTKREGPAAYGLQGMRDIYRMGIVAVTSGGGITAYCHGGYWGTFAAYVPGFDLAIGFTRNQQAGGIGGPQIIRRVIDLVIEAGYSPIKVRARDLGIPFAGTPGPLNAITDVNGVEVGHTTLIRGVGRLIVGQGPVRTGVTAILPRGKEYAPVFAGWFALNGNGEMTGTTWVDESGFLEGPIMITNTHSVGIVRDAVIAWQADNEYFDPVFRNMWWSLPVVAETYDGFMSDINGFHVTKEHVFSALDSAKGGPVPEGNVGGGTGMMCHGFKGGIGTASRELSMKARSYTLGVLVQANYGLREHLMIAGVPVGREIADLMPDFKSGRPDTGSIIVVVATDAPLLPHQLKRIARRVPLGIAKVGGVGDNGSGDIFIAFSTANPGAAQRSGIAQLQMLPNDMITPLFEATVQATEEAIVNALVTAETMTGINGNTIHALPTDRLKTILRRYNRMKK